MCGGPLARQPISPDQKEQTICGGCDFIFYLNPKLVAATLPIIDGRLLLIRRAIAPSLGKWTFPGGFVEWGEPVEHAAIRETREEVNIEVALDGVHGVYSYVNEPIAIVVYRARLVNGHPSAGSEVQEIRLVTPEEVPWSDLAFPSTFDALRDWVHLERGILL
jgi:ADP-ribose pyrophosphatase YjhB (NUDIX family)